MDGPRSLWHKSGRYRKLAVKRRSGGESLGRETPKPRMCVGRNRDQPWSYRYCRISFRFRPTTPVVHQAVAIIGGLAVIARNPAGAEAAVVRGDSANVDRRNLARFSVLIRRFRSKPLSSWEFGRSPSYPRGSIDFDFFPGLV
jgi:hypothetical protein